MIISDAIIQLHNIAREINEEAPNEAFQIRRIADNLNSLNRENKEREERTRYTRPKKNMVIIGDCVVGEDND